MEKNVRVYRIDPSNYVTARKAILEELMMEANMDDEEVNKIFEEFHTEPWSESVLDAVIDRVASRLGIVIRYEFPQ
ncbi:hypothetical protein [Thermofilum sp.]|jgi:predicted metal-binding transcription factor (methanogenesis marker protein 9)|uniref:hypothetical protein n=1 Tax=Thermofilum sp. TaxID=1961369 RepID=UPI00258E26D8|nr:hypothetical protein [Thermofilum sp.]